MSKIVEFFETKEEFEKKVNEVIDNVKSPVTDSFQSILSESKFKVDENEDEEEKTEVSKELAGVIVCCIQQSKSNIITQDVAMTIIRNFYEFEHGKLLKSKQLHDLVFHENVKNYDKKIAHFAKIKEERRKKFELINKVVESEFSDTKTKSEE